jgi:hypothetical protein
MRFRRCPSSDSTQNSNTPTLAYTLDRHIRAYWLGDLMDVIERLCISVRLERAFGFQTQ